VVTPWIAVVGALGYNDAVHKHLRRLERIYVDAPMYFVTSCTKNRRQLLARDEVANILIDEWRAAQNDMAGLLGDTSSCPITYIFSAGLNWRKTAIRIRRVLEELH
jgi:hypothetical protein